MKMKNGRYLVWCLGVSPVIQLILFWKFDTEHDSLLEGIIMLLSLLVHDSYL